jgi:predicted ATPase
MGDAINLAARMQTAARPMGILITEHTYRFVTHYADCADLGAIAVKGKAEPVHVYEVQGLKDIPDNARGLAGLESPLVGRDSEQAVLMQTAAAVQAGLGRVVIISGEAGLGKSRLAAEWKSQAMVSYPFMRWAEGRSLSYGQGLAYHLLVDLLRSLLGVSISTSEEETRTVLAHQLNDLFAVAFLDVYPYLGHLLSLQLEEPAMDRVRQLDPQALQAQYLSALRQLLRAMAVRQPLVMILEDIHWADPSSTELLTKLLPLAAEAPVLFCLLTRPDRDAPGWKLIAAAHETIGAGMTEINLRSLNEADSRKLVANLLEIEALPENVRSLILKKAEGNPFFVEEVIRMLIERRAIILDERGWVAAKEMESIEIPDNLQGLLLARIDRLPEDVRQTLRVAAVIGRQFPVKVLELVLKAVS